MTLTLPSSAAPARSARLRPGRLALPLALILVFAVFAQVSPGFLSPANLTSILVNNVALLAIVSLAMTFAVASGGIDLSLGTAMDFAGFTLITLVLAGQPLVLALAGAVAAGALVGLFNAVLITAIGITPFLATLGTLFLGRSLQQLLTNGGNPVYLAPDQVSPALRALGQGSLAGLPVALVILPGLGLISALILGASRFGRVITLTGVQAAIVQYSGLRLNRHLALTYILAGAIAAVAGLMLTAQVTVYIPNSGNAFTLNAIGATFIGTTLSRHGRPNIPGTLLGVLLLGLVANGLLLSGLNFYWQQVATGLLILGVLGFSFISRAR